MLSYYVSWLKGTRKWICFEMTCNNWMTSLFINFVLNDQNVFSIKIEVTALLNWDQIILIDWKGKVMICNIADPLSKNFKFVQACSHQVDNNKVQRSFFVEKILLTLNKLHYANNSNQNSY